MVTAIIPEKEEMLSVKEIGDILAETLRECGATVAYLGGEYVRADRYGDIRDGDELTLFVAAEELPSERVDRYEHYHPALRVAEDNGIFLRLYVHSHEEIESEGGLEISLRLIRDDWTEIGDYIQGLRYP